MLSTTLYIVAESCLAKSESLPYVAPVYEIVCKYLHVVRRCLHLMKFNMAAVCHLAFVLGSRGTIHEGPFMVAVPCKILKFRNDQCSSVEVMSV